MASTDTEHLSFERGALTFSAQAMGDGPVVRLYLDDAPSASEVAEVLQQLGIKPWELLRRGEKVFKELGLDKDAADKALIEAMSANPILIERPIVINGGDAALGRPPESVMRLFD